LAASPEAEVLNVSPHGLWLLVDGKEHFLDYEQFPWFKDAVVRQIFDVQFLHGHHLRWPQLDVDLELDSLGEPQNYPLIAG
jgi:hypothetical protein